MLRTECHMRGKEQSVQQGYSTQKFQVFFATETGGQRLCAHGTGHFVRGKRLIGSESATAEVGMRQETECASGQAVVCAARVCAAEGTACPLVHVCFTKMHTIGR